MQTVVLKYRSSGLFGYFVQGSLPSTIIFAISIKIFFNMIILMSSFAISFTIYYLGTIIFFLPSGRIRWLETCFVTA